MRFHSADRKARYRAAAALAFFSVTAACGDAAGPGPALPDQIAFIGWDASLNRDRVYLVDEDGANLRVLTPPSAPVRIVGRLAWAPDGRRLAFSDGSDIYALDVEAAGAAPVRLTAARAAGTIHDRFTDPHWAPDGERIAYGHVRAELPGAEQRTLIRSARICIMRGDGSAAGCLDGLPPASDPAWAADGRRLAFSGLAPGFASPPGEASLCPAVIYVAMADGSGARPVTTPSADLAARGACSTDQQPAWEPDGGRIAFTSDRDRGDHTFSVELYTVTPGGGGLTRLTRAPDGVQASRSEEPSWSPDGRRLAYAYTGTVGSPTPGLYVMAPDGSSPTLVFAGVVDAPAWRPRR